MNILHAHIREKKPNRKKPTTGQKPETNWPTCMRARMRLASYGVIVFDNCMRARFKRDKHVRGNRLDMRTGYVHAIRNAP